ncbi:unnamed protein product [Ectocarpus sp. CCAP 1310/34]|nr:unnamed protein product [Ectocarpus sp. CCAP 1310/34]
MSYWSKSFGFRVVIIRSAPRVSYCHLFLTQQPCASKKRKKIRHDYRSVLPEYEDMTTERLVAEGHVATGSFFIDHNHFAQEAEKSNVVTIGGKRGDVTEMGKTRSGGWMCITIHDPAAPSNFKQLEIGEVDGSKAKGGHAINPFRAKPDGTTDATTFDCPSPSYHIMDRVGTGLHFHAHHQAKIDKRLLDVHGAATTFVDDMNPINPDTFIQDVDVIARGTAGALGPNAGCESAPVPPPTDEQIGVSSGPEQTSDWHKLQKETNLEAYTEDRRAGGE